MYLYKVKRRTPPQHLGTYRVSSRGQLSLPADARRHWGLEDGGPVELADLGHAALLIPGGSGTLRRVLGQVVNARQYERLVEAVEDPDLTTQ